jgi:AraC-like DNA-binding protein
MQSNPGPQRTRIHDGWNVFLEEHLSSFPIFVRNDLWLRRWTLPQHRQPGIEINITHVGRAFLSVNHQVYPQSDRLVSAFPGTCAHDFEVNGSASAPYKQTVICINESLLCTLLQAHGADVDQQLLDRINAGYFEFTLTTEQWTRIDTLCAQLVDVFRHKTPWWQQLVSADMTELLTVLFRPMRNDFQGNKTLANPRNRLSGEHTEQKAAQLIDADWYTLCQRYVDRNLDKKLTLEEVARRFYISPEHLTRTFHKIYGMPFQRYVQQQRIKLACQLLAKADTPIAEITCAVGFQSRSHFHRVFRTTMGVTPNDYRLAVSKGNVPPETL